jgi:hypothetical protein
VALETKSNAEQNTLATTNVPLISQRGAGVTSEG